MSNQINDGGPAFPTPAGIQHNDGMTLRDYFAAAALSSMDATRELSFLEPGKENSQMAQRAYRIADAMIKAKEAKP